MAEWRQWRFGADEAPEAAHEVVHHTPNTAWPRIPLPADAEAAAVAVTMLAQHFQALPASIRGAMGQASSNAAQLSDDRLQGLAELLQNADDVGADTAYFLVDHDRLLFGHNGGDLTLPDVWGLTIPWLSEKSDQADTLGRFGIGLKTLQALSETLEAHNGYFHLTVGRSTLTVTDPDPAWPARPEAANTVFVVPFQHAATTEDEVAAWLRTWGDAGLLFLRTLRTVTLLSPDGTAVVRLHLTRPGTATVTVGGGEITRAHVSAADGRGWLLYRRDVPSPDVARAGKARSDTTPVAVAFPQFAGDDGYVHVGLPLRPVGLPFRFAGQLDPLANRRDVADSPWNLAVLELVAALWRDAALDLFATNPSRAWAAVPLGVEAETSTLSTGPLHGTLARALMHQGRLALADGIRLDGGDGTRHPLNDLAFESADLTEVLSADDLVRITGAAGVITPASRSTDDRWRRVLAELAAIGAATPTIVAAADAVPLLDDHERPVKFVADLTAAVVATAISADKELEVALSRSSCLVLADGTRRTPAASPGHRALLPGGPAPLWVTLALGAQLHPDYTTRPGWPTVADWLISIGSLRRTATDEDALRVLADAGRNGVELSHPLTDRQADTLRSALEAVDETARPALGAGIGQAIRLEATIYANDGTRTSTYARPADAYFIEHEKGNWSVAARRTPGLVWLHRRYSEDLRSDTGRAGIGPQRLFRLLGAESVPRLVPLPDLDGYYKHYRYYASGLWRDAPGSPPRRTAQMAAVGARCTLNDLASPDLDRGQAPPRGQPDRPAQPARSGHKQHQAEPPRGTVKEERLTHRRLSRADNTAEGSHAGRHQRFGAAQPRRRDEVQHLTPPRRP